MEFRKSIGWFGTYERTEFILNMLSGYLSMPKSVYREITTGLIVKKGELSPNEVREEEWFPISQTDDWSVNLTVYHKNSRTIHFRVPQQHYPLLRIHIP